LVAVHAGGHQIMLVHIQADKAGRTDFVWGHNWSSGKVGPHVPRQVGQAHPF
jgi:hypothetical protein